MVPFYLFVFLVKLHSIEILHVHHTLLYMNIIILTAILVFLLSFLNIVNKMSHKVEHLFPISILDLWFPECCLPVTYDSIKVLFL